MKWSFNPLMLVAVVALASGCEKVEKIDVKPAELKFTSAGQKEALQARGLTKEGKPVKDAKLTFASSDDKVAKVDATGSVAAVKSGKATITVKSEEKSAQVPVTVVIPATLTIQGAPFTLTGLETTVAVQTEVQDDAGQPIPDTKVELTSADSKIVEVSGGQLIAKGVGTTSVTATSGDLKQSFDVTVKLPEVAEVALEAPPATLKVGESTTLAAVAKAADGAAIKGVSFSFTSSNEKIATVDATGTVKAVKAGAATIKAESGGKVTEAKLTIKK